MKKNNPPIIVTGAGGFIGAVVVKHLIEHTDYPILAVDDFHQAPKSALLGTHERVSRYQRETLLSDLPKLPLPAAVIHLGARTDTAETNQDIFDRLNITYSIALWDYCTAHAIPFLYASSAATYGDGSLGFDDDHGTIPDLQPLNPYGWSKQNVDLHFLAQAETPPLWAGFKFFNVYGPGEDNKGRMASVVWHTFHQIAKTGAMRLFRSHRPDIANGHQSRDFIYVRDIAKVLTHFLTHANPQLSGIFNLGTGQARTFLDLAQQTFIAQGLEPQISFIDTPADIRDTYQYYTQANMSKLRAAGYTDPFTSLEEGVNDYVQTYLLTRKK